MRIWGGGFSAELFDVAEPIEETFGYDVHEVSNKYGEYADTYALNKKWLSLLESIDTKGITFGYFGETMRPLEEINKFYKLHYSLLDMIRDLHCRSNFEKNTLHSDTIYDFIESEMLPLTEGMNTEDLTCDEVFKLFTYSRFEADAILDNFTNTFTCAFPILAQKIFADANFSIPYEWREGDYFSLSLTKKFCPKLLEVPFFSHHHFVIYDPVTNTVRGDISSAMRGKFASVAPGLFKLLKKIYVNVMSLFGSVEDVKRKNEQKIVRFSEEIIRNSKTVTRSKLKFIGKSQAAGYIPFVAASCKIADTLIDD